MAIQRRGGDADGVQLDMTPMLDVVFIMLIFFIVTASFVKESGIDVNRPTATTAEKKPLATIFIGIGGNNQIWIQKKRTDVRAVRATIERMYGENPGGSIVIQADKDSKSEVLLKVMDAVRQAGVPEVSIAAMAP